MLPPRPLLGAALLALAGLSVLIETQDDPVVSPQDALQWEGQRIILKGIAIDVRLQPGGPTRFHLVAEGHAVAARASDQLFIDTGTWVEVPGRLARIQGELTLLVAQGAKVRVVIGPDPAEPTWDDVAMRPDHWATRSLRLAGTVDHGDLRDGAGHRLRIGDGSWPKAGAVDATGLLRYDDGCLCHRFDAIEVVPWTS